MLVPLTCPPKSNVSVDPEIVTLAADAWAAIKAAPIPSADTKRPGVFVISYSLR
jgi:hypothetical protein